MDRFGPVGMGIELIQPAFTMRIKNIEEGSPAAATGKLEKGQIIESINGQALKDIDPRIQLAGMIEKAEATDGKLSFKIKDLAEPVVVELPVLGAYSESWPLDCPKSDKIVRGLADYIGSPEGNKGIGDIGMIFLLSTGDEKDLAVVRDWARKTKPHTYAWYPGSVAFHSANTTCAPVTRRCCRRSRRRSRRQWPVNPTTVGPAAGVSPA